MILQTDAYDPTESDDRPRSSHVSKKEILVVAVVLTVLIFVMWPVYVKFKGQRDKHVCKDQLLQISRGLLLYADENSGRLPPLYVMGDNFEPVLFKGRANTWISLIAPGVKGEKAAFRCPGAEEAETAPNAAPGGDTILSTYGLYGAMSSAPLEHVPNTASQVMVAETSNGGARGTYNPIPILDKAGKVMPDGFVIGLDNSNFLPDDSDMTTFAKSTAATRLAFYDTAKGDFTAEKIARHPTGIHVLFADGHIETVQAPFAHVTRATKSGEIIRAWQLR